MVLKYNEQEEEAEQTSYLEEIDFLFKLDNTLQRKKIVYIQDSKGNIASTNMKCIFLNFDEIKSISDHEYFDFLLNAKAFNYHELCHILFTRYGHVRNQIHRAINLLEDQRIENLFVEKYPRSEHYFRNLYLGYLLKEGIHTGMLFPLLYGRRMILKRDDIIQKARALFVDEYSEQDTQEVEKIIDEYLVTLDTKKQRELAERLNNIIYNPNNPLSHNNPYSRQDKKTSSKEEKETVIILSRKIEKDNKQKDKRSGSGNIQVKSDAQKDKIKKELKDEASKDIDDVKEKLKEEIENQMNRMKKRGFGAGSNFINESEMIFYPEQKHNIMAKKILNIIGKLKTDLDNKTVYKQKKGKIDLRSAMNNNSYKINDFKRFIPSRLNKTRLGVSLIIDASGSMMNDDFDIAIGSAWSVAKALELSGSYTKVFEFSDGYRTLKEFKDDIKHSQWGRSMGGGTDPYDAIINAEKSLKELEKKQNVTNKIIILFTDGGFNDIGKIEDKCNELKKSGFYVALICLGTYSHGYSNYNKDNYSKYVHIRGFSELPKTMSQIVMNVQAEVISKVKREVH